MVCTFQDKWLTDPELSDWTVKVTGQPTKARCVVCKKDIDVSSMGKGAVVSHSSGTGHQKRIKIHLQSISGTLQISFPTRGNKNDSSTTSASGSNDVPNSSAGPSHQPSTASANDVTESEILWALYCVEHHIPYNANEGIKSIFQRMFSDSEIARLFSCGATKTSYIVKYGLCQYFQDILEDRLADSEYVTVLFDESLNKVTQTKQLDILARYWDNGNGRIETRFLDSRFLGHARATDLVDSMMSIKSLKPKQIAQVRYFHLIS